MNDLHKALKDTYYILFASDSNVFTEHTGYVIARISKDVGTTVEWLKTDKFSLNTN